MILVQLSLNNQYKINNPQCLFFSTPTKMSNDSGASKTYPKQCSALRKGEFVMIKGCPCKISSLSTSKTGKHGHAKVMQINFCLASLDFLLMLSLFICR